MPSVMPWATYRTKNGQVLPAAAYKPVKRRQIVCKWLGGGGIVTCLYYWWGVKIIGKYKRWLGGYYGLEQR